MLERGATLPARRKPLPDLGKQLGPLAGLAGTVLILAVLAGTVGIGGAGWLVGLASGLALNLALARALWRDPSAGLGWASWVTLTRATLAVGVAALTAASFELPVATAAIVVLASIALALDFADGWIARRTQTQSALGAKLDGEVDAFLILVLSIEVAPTVGGWVLLIGLMRYLFLAAGWALPWLRAPLPRRDWRKTVTASQGIALVVAASGVPPLWLSRVLLAVALAMLAESFGRDVWWLWRHRDEAPAHTRAAWVRHPVTAAVLTVARPRDRVVHARLPDPAVAAHAGRLRADPARGARHRRAGDRPPHPRSPRRAVDSRASARRPRPDQGLRPRLLHRVRPDVQPGRGLELLLDRLRDGAGHVRAAATRISRSWPPRSSASRRSRSRRWQSAS